MIFALLLQAAAATTPPAPLPDAPQPQPHRLRDAASHVAFVVSTRKSSSTTGRVFGGGVLLDLDPHLSVSAGYEGLGWAAQAVIRPVPKKP